MNFNFEDKEGILMKMSSIVGLLFPSIVVSGPFLVSDSTDYLPAPTHCVAYWDGSTEAVMEPVLMESVTDPVSGEEKELPYCKFDLSNIEPGDHTVKVAFAIDQGTWGVYEGMASEPFSFNRPETPEGIPVPVLRIEITVNLMH